jgi:tetratricopeptide (TPR) repeat protein
MPDKTKGLTQRLARRPAWLTVVLICAAVFVVYLPSLKAGFIWDDPEFITDNPHLKNAEGLRTIWFEPRENPHYYPLLLTVFWFLYNVWGDQAAVYHLLNVLLHAANAVLLYRILAGLGLRSAWLAALGFGLHPLHAESVAWVTEMKNTLSAAFYLSAVHVWMRPSFRGGPARVSWARFAVVALLFFCALMTKTTTISLPPAIALCECQRHGRLGRASGAKLAALLAAGLVPAVFSVWVERRLAVTPPFLLPTFAERLIVTGRSLWFYFSKIVWPSNLAMIYERSPADAGDPLQYGYLLAAAIAVWTLVACRRRLPRGAVGGVLFFVVTLLPIPWLNINFVLFYSWVADHFAYLPSLGLIPVAAAAFHRAVSGWRPAAMAAALGAAVAVPGFLTWRQAHIYEDQVALWSHNVRIAPRQPFPYLMLSDLLWKRGEKDEALALTRKTWDLAGNNPMVYYRLGIALAEKEHFAEAVEAYRRALELQPRTAEFNARMASALAGSGDHGKTVEYLRKALELDREMPEAHNNLAASLFAMGRVDEALAHFHEELRLHPNSAPTHNNLGSALARMGKVDAAAVHLAEAIRLKPDFTDARINLGLLLYRQGRLKDAALHLARGLKEQPDRVDARINLGSALARLGLLDEALQHLGVAVTHAPDSAEAHYNYGVVLRLMKRDPEADRHFAIAKELEHGTPAP